MEEGLRLQWQAFANAPLVYLIASAFIVLITWRIIHFLYRHRIEGLKEELERAKHAKPTPAASTESPSLRTELQTSHPAPSGTRHAVQNEKTEGTSLERARTFVPDRITPQALMEICKGKTQHKANLELGPYMGKWIRVRAKVGQLSKYGDTWQLILETNSEDRILGSTCVDFNDSFSARLEVLDVGDIVEVEGQISRVDALTVWIQDGILIE